ncbi:beta-1,3-galactosyltransferase GALT1-like [Coffea eugenioides]|nr:beta-1,3-galactosyltransferase GALT1-like [Coffea eugenioides]
MGESITSTAACISAAFDNIASTAQVVNEELWNEAKTYGDIQLMPFVDYYSLITWKTLAICVFGTQVVSAKFVMKTDDDAFVRVDEILASLNRINVSRGLLYGLINSDSHPHRSPDSKWYISPEVLTRFPRRRSQSLL